MKLNSSSELMVSNSIHLTNADWKLDIWSSLSSRVQEMVNSLSCDLSMQTAKPSPWQLRCFFHVQDEAVLESWILSGSLLSSPSLADHLEGVCQHSPLRASGSGRWLPKALQTTGEGPLWGHWLWQHLLPAKQVSPTFACSSNFPLAV